MSLHEVSTHSHVPLDDVTVIAIGDIYRGEADVTRSVGDSQWRKRPDVGGQEEGVAACRVLSCRAVS